MDDTRAFSDKYDIFTSSDDYASRFDGPVGEWMLRVQEQATLRMLAPYTNASVLYVGGGHGQGINALLRNGGKITVFSSDECCKARIRSYVDAGWIGFDVGNILEMPYPDRAFDVVLCYRLTAHVTDLRRYLRELARVAARAVVLDYPEARSINFAAPWLYGLKKRLEPNTRRFTCFRERQLLEVFEQCGFHRADRFPQYLLPMMFHRRLHSPGLSQSLETVFRTTGLTGLLGSPVIVKVERLVSPTAHD